MKLLTTSNSLQTEFARLIKQYSNYYWATAWASTSPKLFNELLLLKDRINKITVGIHFYQTDPDFIEAFIGDDRVRFIQQPDGTFHPKLYLFMDSEDKWELLIGSANFTGSAFSQNTEATVLISDRDTNSSGTFISAKKLVEETWKEAKCFNSEELENYRITWKNQRPKIKSLSGLYGSIKRKPKPINEVPITTKKWSEFITDVFNEEGHGVDNRLKAIDIAKNLFKKADNFSKLKPDEREFIAGIPNKLALPDSQTWPFFGSMKGAGIFQHKIKENNINISKALDQIPFEGQITRTHYDSFISYYTQAFSGNYIGTATRLLTMKRPDTFICFDSKNKVALCKDFGISPSGMNYERYWDDIILRIFDSEWWLHPTPQNVKETKVSEARAAFLDSLYYKE